MNPYTVLKIKIQYKENIHYYRQNLTFLERNYVTNIPCHTTIFKIIPRCN